MKRVSSILPLLIVGGLLLSACGETATVTPPRPLRRLRRRWLQLQLRRLRSHQPPQRRVLPQLPQRPDGARSARSRSCCRRPRRRAMRARTCPTSRPSCKALGFDVQQPDLLQRQPGRHRPAVAGRGRPDQRRQGARARPGGLRRRRRHRRRWPRPRTCRSSRMTG